jgi:hypothetical protein
MISDTPLGRSEVKKMFDTQLEKMYQLIDSQLDRMPTIAPHDHVVSISIHRNRPNIVLMEIQKYLVLSGGLGSSEYVFHELQRRYAQEGRNLYAPHLRVVRTSYP